MSLKFFHIVFIAMSTILSVWFGVWALRAHYTEDGHMGFLLAGILSFAAGALLVYYGNKFFKKMKDVK